MRSGSRTPSDEDKSAHDREELSDKPRSAEPEGSAFVLSQDQPPAATVWHPHSEARRRPPPLPHLRAASDPALSPVERQITKPAHSRTRGAWLGWLAAGGLVVCGGAHYLWEDRPQQQQRARAELARARQQSAHAARLSDLESNLESTRAELDRANAQVAAQKAAIAEAAATAEKADETPAAEPATQKASPARRTARHGRRAHTGADGHSTKARPRTTLSKAHERSQPLHGILSNSNDPLEGL
ncbi:MAG TPA: hypothetical protein VFN67_28485 [Polyangiales bacterium]|nr:hypothetical protein [Polyangiales bacterium]